MENRPENTPFRSVSTWFDPLISVVLILTAFFYFRGTALSNTHLILLITLITATYFFLSEFLRANWEFSDRPTQKISEIFNRTVTKFAGVLVGIGMIGFAVWLFPTYGNPRDLSLLGEAILPFLSFIFPASFILIFFTEYILGEKKDGTYHLGLFAQGQFRDINWRVFFDGVLEWLVRGIFVLINFVSVSIFVSRYRDVAFADFTANIGRFVIELDGLVFMVILFAILPGYIFASRLIGTEVKKVDHTWFGWMITLAAYPPLNAAVFGGWMQYTPSVESLQLFQGVPVWVYLTQQFPPALYFVGVMILLAGLFHLWGEAQMGIRSSNLSRRGIITIGPFRFTKHPVYVSKCVQWAFIYFPVLNAIGLLSSLQSGLLFLMVCLLFVGRAVAEEKLLAEDPDYVRYALAMDEKGVFAFVGRLLPFMSFRWRYDYWKRNSYLVERF